MKKKSADADSNPIINVKPTPTPTALDNVENTATVKKALDVASVLLSIQVNTVETTTIQTPNIATVSARNRLTSPSLQCPSPNPKRTNIAM